MHAENPCDAGTGAMDSVNWRMPVFYLSHPDNPARRRLHGGIPMNPITGDSVASICSVCGTPRRARRGETCERHAYAHEAGSVDSICSVLETRPTAGARRVCSWRHHSLSPNWRFSQIPTFTRYAHGGTPVPVDRLGCCGQAVSLTWHPRLSPNWCAQYTHIPTLEAGLDIPKPHQTHPTCLLYTSPSPRD